jgi:hypothetical protein
MSPVRRISTLAVALAVGAATIVVGALPASADSDVRVLVDGLSSPKGIAFAPNRNAVVSQGAFGAPGPVLEVVLRGADRKDLIELTDPEGLVDVVVAADGSGWGIGDGVLGRRAPDGTVSEVLDIVAYQATDPDPVDIDMPANPIESNAYGLGVLPNGDALVADAAGNDIIRVSPDGTARTIARFDLRLVATDHVPEFGLDPEIPAEAVPTTVTVGPDGYIYVGLLTGFPFRPGSSRIWRINPDADGVFCSDAEPDPDCTVYADGFSAIQDIAFDRNNGHLYVYELAEDGVFAFEAGLETGDAPPAVLTVLKKNGQRRVIADDELREPGGIIVLNNGNILVTDRVFTEGGGRLVRITGNGDHDD